MKKENNGRNILNVAEIEAFLDLQIRGKSKPFQQWLRRNLRNYILKEEKSLLCLPANLRSLLHAMAVAVGGTPDRMKNKFRFLKKSEQPEWFERAFAEGDDIHYISINEEEYESRIGHWYDYVRADLADKDISRITVAEMGKQTEAWVKRLQREKVLSEDLKNITSLWENDQYRLVRLDARDAYILEGQRMNNCVKTYWQTHAKGSAGRRPYEIYSVRTLDNNPVLTLEVWEFSHDNRGSVRSRLRPATGEMVPYVIVRQAKANSNAKPTKEILALAMKALKAAFPGRSAVFESQLPPAARNAFINIVADEDEDEDYEEEADDDEEVEDVEDVDDEDEDDVEEDTRDYD
jgi:hypothetical protein